MMTGREVEQYYEMHHEWQEMKWDLSDLMKLIYGGESKQIRVSRYAHMEFTPLGHTSVCREMKLVILYLLLNRHYKRQQNALDFLKTASLFIQYVGAILPFESLNQMTMKDMLAFTDYASRKIAKVSLTKSFPRLIRQVWHDEFCASDWFEKDLWDLREVPMNPLRINRAVSVIRVNFFLVENPDNKKLLKAYIQHLIEDRNISHTSVCIRFTMLKSLLKDCKKSLQNINSRELKELLIHERSLSHGNKYNDMISCIADFYHFCNLEHMLPDMKINFSDFKLRKTTKLKYKGLPYGARKQIFDHIHELPPAVACIFLIIYCTGMYLSEACQLTADCLNEKNGAYYIRVTKLHSSNVVSQPIPKLLFEYLKSYRDQLLKQCPGEFYLFPGSEHKPLGSGIVTQHMHRLILAHHITDEEGKLLSFRFKALKHDLAYRMLDDELSPLTIQNLLHAETVESALLYSEIRERKKRDKYYQFLRKTGITNFQTEKKEDRQVIWIRKRMAQILPDGYCSYPVKLGLCPHANQCLFCDSFHTTRDFLPVFYRQSAKLSMFIHTLEKAGKDDRYEAAVRVKKRIDFFIQTLEADHDADSRGKAEEAQ